MRVVSLNCSNTEIVHALGCGDLLVGVDSDSDWPPELVERLPRVGRDLEIDVARVRALEPDVVLASLTVPGHEAVVAALERAGLPFHAPETTTLDDVYADVRHIGTLLGVPERAADLVERMRTAIGTPDTEPDATAPAILVQWWPKPVIAPGRRSWIDGLLRAAGARNPLGDREVKSQPLSDADVVALDPDAIVISWCGVRPEKYRPDVVYERAGWQDLRAVQGRQVHCVAEAFLGRPGPRLVDGARALRDIVRALR